MPGDFLRAITIWLYNANSVDFGVDVRRIEPAFLLALRERPGDLPGENKFYLLRSVRNQLADWERTKRKDTSSIEEEERALNYPYPLKKALFLMKKTYY